MVGWLVLSGSSDLDWAQHPGCRVLDGVTEKAAQRHRHEGAREAGKSLEERSKIASIEAEAPIRTPTRHPNGDENCLHRKPSRAERVLFHACAPLRTTHTLTLSLTHTTRPFPSWRTHSCCACACAGACAGVSQVSLLDEAQRRQRLPQDANAVDVGGHGQAKWPIVPSVGPGSLAATKSTSRALLPEQKQPGAGGSAGVKPHKRNPNPNSNPNFNPNPKLYPTEGSQGPTSARRLLRSRYGTMSP